MIYTATLPSSGPYRLHYPSVFEEHLNSLRRDKDVKIDIKITKHVKQRSVFQNSYYWGVVVELVRKGFIDIGFNLNKDETHEYLKTKFLSYDEINEKTGEVFKFIKSSSKLSTADFMAYLEDIKMWAATTLDLYIPEPNEQLEIDSF